MKFLLIPFLFLIAGCTSEAVVAPTSVSPQTGCVVVSDEYGDREICDTQYYYANGGVVYWDSTFGIWVGPGGYWRGGKWFRGYHPGWRAFYGPSFYQRHGWFNGHDHAFHGHGYLDHNYGRGGGSYHGHGGHGGHR